jgi:hypothetical protein
MKYMDRTFKTIGEQLDRLTHGKIMLTETSGENDDGEDEEWFTLDRSENEICRVEHPYTLLRNLKGLPTGTAIEEVIRAAMKGQE